jgi:hypothetical protein
MWMGKLIDGESFLHLLSGFMTQLQCVRSHNDAAVIRRALGGAALLQQQPPYSQII